MNTLFLYESICYFILYTECILIFYRQIFYRIDILLLRSTTKQTINKICAASSASSGLLVSRFCGHAFVFGSVNMYSVTIWFTLMKSEADVIDNGCFNCQHQSNWAYLLFIEALSTFWQILIHNIFTAPACQSSLQTKDWLSLLTFTCQGWLCR